MRICYYDCKRFQYRKTGTYSTAEESDVEEVVTNSSLVIQVGVEEQDEPRLDDVIERAVKETTGLFESVETTSLVLFPRPHIVGDPAPVHVRTELMQSLASTLISKHGNQNIFRVPEGHRGEVELSIRGHPLATLRIDF